MPFETPPQPKNEEKKYSRREFIQKLADGLTVAAFATPLPGKAAETPQRNDEAAKKEEPISKENRDQIAQELHEAHFKMLSKVDHLHWYNGGIQFLSAVRDNYPSLELFLKNPEASQSLPPGPLDEIVKIYAKPLAKAKRLAPDLYQRDVDRFNEAIMVIRNNSNIKVKPLLRKIFSRE